MDSNNTRKDYDLWRRSREIKQDALVVKEESSASQSPQQRPGPHDISGNNSSGRRLDSSATQAIQPTPGLYNFSGNSGRELISIFAATKLTQPTADRYNVSGNRGSGQRLVSSATQLIQLGPGKYKLLGNRESVPLLVSSATQSVQPVPGRYSVSGNIGSVPRLVFSAAQSIQPALAMPPEHMHTGSNGKKGVCVFKTENSRVGNVGVCRSGMGNSERKGNAGACRSGMGNSKRKLSELEKDILINKARTVIRNKLNECKAASRDINKNKPADDRVSAALKGPKAEGLKSMEVPDSEFHDFDNNRAEESFSQNQVWAVYDEDDGMPRLYALIRKASGRPFKLQLSWLNSESNMEPKSIKWIDCGFHKTCGNFHVENKRLSLNLNSFSHRVVGWTKAANVFQIFPKKGQVWALYSNWSPNWNEHTSEEEKHKYDMVDVLQDYNEEKGVTIIPLVKVSGFKAVFCQQSDTKEVRTVPKEEIFRFSHQVSSYLLTDQEAPNVPKGSKELDPAAMPLELLQIIH